MGQRSSRARIATIRHDVSARSELTPFQKLSSSVQFYVWDAWSSITELGEKRVLRLYELPGYSAFSQVFDILLESCASPAHALEEIINPQSSCRCRVSITLSARSPGKLKGKKIQIRSVTYVTEPSRYIRLRSPLHHWQALTPTFLSILA